MANIDEVIAKAVSLEAAAPYSNFYNGIHFSLIHHIENGNYFEAVKVLEKLQNPNEQDRKFVQDSKNDVANLIEEIKNLPPVLEEQFREEDYERCHYGLYDD